MKSFPIASLSRIEISGGIASGKTTFATVIRGLVPGVVFENFKKVPTWEAFYSNPGKYIFETEIAFTLLHYHQIKKAVEKGTQIIVCDFSFSLDLAYAKIGLKGSQLDAFETVCQEVYKELGLPSILVHLKCDAETELDRVRKRGRDEETSITLEFLDSLNNAVENEVSLIKAKVPVITIDSSLKDFATHEPTKEEMRELMRDHIKSLPAV